MPVYYDTQDARREYIKKHPLTSSIDLMSFSHYIYSNVEYNYEDKNTFFGGNEFRNFDIKSIKFYSINIKRIDFDSLYNVYLMPEVKRTFQNYSTKYDINGKRLTRRIESDQTGRSNTEADYCNVYFELKYEETGAS